MGLLFSQVFGCPCLSYAALAAPVVLQDAGQAEGEEGEVEHEVGAPAEVAEDAAAGAGDTFPEAEEDEGDVAAEQGQQEGAEEEAAVFGFGKKQQGGGAEFAERQQPGQGVGGFAGDGLVEEFPAELVKIEQLAYCGIGPEEDEQGGGDGAEPVAGRLGFPGCPGVQGIHDVFLGQRKGWNRAVNSGKRVAKG
nr:hypothetical protein [Mucilaginibacter ginsenosidivorans]